MILELATAEHMRIFISWRKGDRTEEQTCRPVHRGQRVPNSNEYVVLAFFIEEIDEPVGKFTYFDFNPHFFNWNTLSMLYLHRQKANSFNRYIPYGARANFSLVSQRKTRSHKFNSSTSVEVCRINRRKLPSASTFSAI